MENIPIYKWFFVIGILLILAGIIWYFFGDKLHWIGRLPGDIRYENGNTKIYFPLVTMLLISLLVNLIIWFIRKFL